MSDDNHGGNPSTGDSGQGRSATDIEFDRAVASSTYKVLGKTTAPDGAGVLGRNTSRSGTNYGVEGVTESVYAGAAGVRGEASATSNASTTHGVKGITQSGGHTFADPSGVLGEAPQGGESNADGVRGTTQGRGFFDGTFDAEHYAAGVAGEATATSGNYTAGVYGQNRGGHDGAVGVYGYAGGTTGRTYGLKGEALSTSGYGVYSLGDTRVEGAVEATEGYRGNVGVSAELTSDHTVAADGRETVQFDRIVDDDDRGEFDTVNHAFEPAYPGDYRVDATVEVDGIPEGERVELELWEDVASNRLAQVKRWGPTAGTTTLSLSVTRTLRDLSTFDDVVVKVDSHASSSLTIVGSASGAQTWIDVTQVA